MIFRVARILFPVKLRGRSVSSCLCCYILPSFLFLLFDSQPAFLLLFWHLYLICSLSVATGTLSKTTTTSAGNAVALADGTIAILSAKEEVPANGDNKTMLLLQWGIQNDYHQLLLSYPAIGCAQVQLQRQMQQTHLACCLRGGTTYLVPIMEDDNDDDNDVADVVVPGESKDPSTKAMSEPLHDITVYTPGSSEISDSQYVQSFTAGNVIIENDNHRPNQQQQQQQHQQQQHHNHHAKEELEVMKAPVLVYGWAGGIVDVYSCELRDVKKESHCCRSMIGHREVDILQELVNNGSAQMLNELLPALLDTDPLLRQPLWKQALKESLQREQQDTTERNDHITVDELLQPEWSALCSLLLLISTDTALLSPVTEGT